METLKADQNGIYEKEIISKPKTILTNSLILADDRVGILSSLASLLYTTGSDTSLLVDAETTLVDSLLCNGVGVPPAGSSRRQTSGTRNSVGSRMVILEQKRER